MKDKLSIREIQLEEKKILLKTINFLDSHKLRYQIAYGTLLGAVRHKGFIPWDDDIDIIMPRPDYDKLQNIMKASMGKIDDQIFLHSMQLNNLNFPFSKVYNHNIAAIDDRVADKFDRYLWIDIFPIDGTSINNKINNKNLNKRKFFAKCIGWRKASLNYVLRKRENVFKKLYKLLVMLVLHVLPYKFASKKIIKIIKKYDYINCDLCANFSWSDKLNEIFPKEYFDNSIEFDFEGIKVKGPKEYDKILTQIYGDYMKLPPIEQRLTHNLNVWRIEDAKSKE